jgi:hypothetical protein
MKQSKHPSGWNERKVRRVLRHYESQAESEAIAEDEAAFELKDQIVMVVPSKLVPEITKLIARRRHGSGRAPSETSVSYDECRANCERYLRTFHGFRYDA